MSIVGSFMEIWKHQLEEQWSRKGKGEQSMQTSPLPSPASQQELEKGAGIRQNSKGGLEYDSGSFHKILSVATKTKRNQVKVLG